MAIEIVSAPPPPPEPLVVALLDDHTVAPPTPIRGPTPARVSVASHATSNPTIGPKVEASTAVTPARPDQPRNPLLTMRRPELDKPTKLDDGISTDFTETFLRNSRPLPAKENPTEQLQAELAAAEGNLKNARWVANATPDEVRDMRLTAMSLRDDLNNRELKPDGAGRKAEHQTFRVKVAADGSARITDKANLQRQGLLGATFDITDAAMRRHGIDPYSSYKLKVLNETRAERVAMGKQHRTQQLAQSRQHMQKNLAHLWATTSDLAARKQGLFELWDDCAETGPDEIVAGGRAARDYAVGFIHSKLPAGTTLAFTADDLTRLNRQRKSHATFAPY